MKINRLIIGASAVLVLIIALTLLITNFTSRPKPSQQNTITPVPTTFGSKNPPNNQEDVLMGNDFAFKDTEINALNAFKTKLPYYSAGLEVAYDSSLDLFFIQKKNTTADDELNSLLAENGLSEVFKERSALFVISEDPIDQSIKNIKDTFNKLEEDGDDAGSANTPAGKTEQDKDISFATKIIQNVQDIGKKSPDAKSGGGTCTTGGGYPFSDRNQNLIGRPYQGTHTLGNWQSDNAVDLGVPIGTPVCAIAAGTIGRIKQNNPNPSSRYAGVSVYLNVGGREWWYTHLTKIAPGIAPGVQVTGGQTIGYSGAANGVPHLHLGVNNGNPIALLGL